LRQDRPQELKLAALAILVLVPSLLSVVPASLLWQGLCVARTVVQQRLLTRKVGAMAQRGMDRLMTVRERVRAAAFSLAMAVPVQMEVPSRREELQGLKRGAFKSDRGIALAQCLSSSRSTAFSQ